MGGLGKYEKKVCRHKSKKRIVENVGKKKIVVEIDEKYVDQKKQMVTYIIGKAYDKKKVSHFFDKTLKKLSDVHRKGGKEKVCKEQKL